MLKSLPKLIGCLMLGIGLETIAGAAFVVLDFLLLLRPRSKSSSQLSRLSSAPPQPPKIAPAGRSR